MKNRLRNIVVLILLWAFPALGQVNVGVSGGWVYNRLSINNGYASDFHYHGVSGGTIGLSAKFDINSFFGVRGDLVWQQRGYRLSRDYAPVRGTRVRQRDDYFLLPVVADFSLRVRRIRFYGDVGAYVGLWSSSRWKGVGISLTDTPDGQDLYLPFATRRPFDKERDNRFEAGVVGGIGADYALTRNLAVGVEARYYRGLTSTTRNYMSVSLPRYNNTVGISATVTWRFGR